MIQSVPLGAFNEFKGTKGVVDSNKRRGSSGGGMSTLIDSDLNFVVDRNTSKSEYSSETCAAGTNSLDF